MGGACRAYGEKRGDSGVLWGNMRKRGQLGVPDVNERIILRWIFR